MIILLGKTARGKDTVQNILLTMGYEKIPTYTTRPMRPGEIAGKTYHYTSEDDFCKKVNEGFFAEHKAYDTVHGVWRYGCSMESILEAKENDIIILTPAGFRDIQKLLPEHAITVLLDSDELTARERLAKRGDNPKEIDRRIQQDEIDFDGISENVDLILYNHRDSSLYDLANKIAEFDEASRNQKMTL